MKDHSNFRSQVKRIHRLLTGVLLVIGIVSTGLIYLLLNPDILQTAPSSSNPAYVQIDETADYDAIENGIHVRTGLKDAPGLMTVVNNCTNCHSAKLVIQNRMNKERWIATIRWMQETQNLWDLGQNEEIIVNYLSLNYPPTQIGRRANLTNINWYVLEE